MAPILESPQALKTAFSDRFGRAAQKRAHRYRDTAAPPLRMEDRLRKQIEFYFSDSNLSKDAYLKGIIAESEEGWVPLSKFLSFNKYALLHWLTGRIKAITTEEGDIRAALERSQVLVMNEDKSCVRRTQPYVEKEIPPSCRLRCGMSCRSFYIRGTSFAAVGSRFREGSLLSGGRGPSCESSS